MNDVSRNSPCPCGSGKKYKKCCGLLETSAPASQSALAPSIRDLFKTALGHHQAGRLDEAKSLYQRILEIAPKEADTLHLLGLIAHAQGDLPGAVRLITRSIGLAPRNAESYYNLGVVLQDQGKLAEAEARYRKAISLDPRHTKAHYNLGNALKDRHRLAEAAASYREAIELYPNDPAAHDNLGNVLHQQGKLADAVVSYRRALALDPDDPETHNNLGITLHHQGLLTEAEASYHAALALRPDFPQALGNLGSALFTQYRPVEAVAACEKAIALDPRFAEAHNNRGIALYMLGDLDAAAEGFRAALALDPGYVDARSNQLFVQNYRLGMPPERMLAEAREYGRHLTARAKRYSSWKALADPDRPLRIGFVSADLCDHPVGYFLESVLRESAAGSLHLVAYPTHLKDDAISRRIRPLFEAWHPVVGMPDEEAARVIREDAIDILIDLSGHTAGNRLPVFAWKPAPVQATWLGYFATTGVAEIDYLIADPWTVPASEDANFTEKIWRLPETRLCFTAPDADVAVTSLPALANGFVTFGCFNNLAKVNDAVVALWSRILSAVPRSRLLLKAHQLKEASTRDSVRARFAAHGVAGARLIVEPPSPRAAYLADYGKVDITLDPFPFPGGTTSAESLWMGVPVLTLAGERMISRQGVGLLMNAGLSDWISSDPDDYLARAAAHAANLLRLGALRSGLRDRLLRSPLLDAKRFARHFEDALRGMWVARLRDMPRNRTRT